MFKSIWNEIENELRNGSMVSKLIIVNCSVFILFLLVQVGDFMVHPNGSVGWASDAAHYFMIPANVKSLLLRIWTPITSMFLHLGVMHILFNMIFLRMFGNIVGDLIGDNRVLPLYLLGGLMGGLAFIAYGNYVSWNADVNHFALGASGAVMALAGAAVTLSPDYTIRLMFIGEVKLKYIVLVMLLIDLLGIADNINTGGRFAHLGGLAYGMFYIHQIQTGDDPADKVNAFIERIQDFFTGRKRIVLRGKSRKKPQMTYRNPLGAVVADKTGHAKSDSLSHQDRIDKILDKIKQEGYDNLTDAEKKYLFDASNKDS